MAMQDKANGGWPFRPGEKCDTLATAVQLTALKNGQLNWLQVDKATIEKAATFLNSVQADNGAAYGRSSSNDITDRSSAAGLLSRICLGWRNDEPNLLRGVRRLTQRGPSDDPFSDYLGTQVIYQVLRRSKTGGDISDLDRAQMVSRNTRLFELRIKSRSTDGHEAGSYCDGVSDALIIDGGRLYWTAAVLMTSGYWVKTWPVYNE